MKKPLAMLMVVALVLSLTGCFGVGNNSDSSADQANARDVSEYDKDFDGLTEYISDRVKSTKIDLAYEILGADDGVRFVVNNNPYVEVYDFSSAVATADSAAKSSDPEKAKEILASIEDNGKFQPLEGGIEMAAVITDSGRYVLAWDESRSYDYKGKIVTDELIENW